MPMEHDQDFTGKINRTAAESTNAWASEISGWPRNPGVQVWDELNADEKRLAARLMEVYAGFIDHADE